MKSFFLAGLLLASLSAIAGDKGNGGYAVVCRDDAGKIISAELLDLYEGRIIQRRNYAVNLNSVADLVNMARTRVANFPNFLSKLDQELEYVEKNKIFIPEGNILEPTDDAFPPINKKGCKFEQLANYQDSGELLIAEEIYEQLDNVNKAGLIIHEAVYSYRRKALGEETSVNSRKLVAHMLAINPDEAVIDRWVRDTLYRPNNKRPCGLEGTIDQRIQRCSYVQESGHMGMVLVTRTKDMKEVWLDYHHHLLISDRLPKTMDHKAAIAACNTHVPEMGDLPGQKWRLPVMEEFSRMSQAYVYMLPNMTHYETPHWFWTGTKKGRSAYIFNGKEGTISLNPFIGSNSGSVRCVSEL